MSPIHISSILLRLRESCPDFELLIFYLCCLPTIIPCYQQQVGCDQERTISDFATRPDWIAEAIALWSDEAIPRDTVVPGSEAGVVGYHTQLYLGSISGGYGYGPD